MLRKITYAIVFCLIASKSYANILFSKTYILLDGKHRSDILETTNLSSKKMRYKVKLVNFKQLENGKYEKIEVKNQNSADNMFYVSPKSFILDNKETQTVRIMRKSLNSKNLKNLENGEYRTHLVVQEVEDLGADFSETEIKEVAKKETEESGMSIEIKGYMGMSIPVVLRKGQLEAGAKITSAKLLDRKGSQFLKVEVARTGDKSVRGSIKVMSNRKEVGVVNNFAIYMESNKRFIEIPLDTESFKGKPLGSIEVSYRDTENKKGQIYSTYTLKN